MEGKLIGITGKKRSGKDTLASYLTQHGYKQFAFAEPIKALCTSLGFSYQQLHDDVRKEIIDDTYFMTPRRMMQLVGENLKLIDEDLWIRAIEKKINNHNKSNIVISDVRFKNEAKFIKSKGGIIIKIIRKGESLDTHISETEMEDIIPDITIENNGSIEDIYNNANKLILGQI